MTFLFCERGRGIYIHYCVTITPKGSGLIQQAFVLPVFVGQEFKSGLLG